MLTSHKKTLISKSFSLLNIINNISPLRQLFCTTESKTKPNGKLSIVATPIGNLSDLTPNILKCLFKADLIGCEDRRVAGQLYTLIRNKNIVQKVQERFGTIGLSNLIVRDQKEEEEEEGSADKEK